MRVATLIEVSGMTGDASAESLVLSQRNQLLCGTNVRYENSLVGGGGGGGISFMYKTSRECNKSVARFKPTIYSASFVMFIIYSV